MPTPTLSPAPEDLVPPLLNPNDSPLARELTLLDALMLNAGVMLVAALFVVPGVVFANTGTAWLSALAWLTAGAITWCGAATFAELGARYPRAGGPYVFLEHAYSRIWGFLYGWTLFAVIQPASIAAVAIACLTYAGTVLPLSPAMSMGGSVALILALSVWNASGLRRSATTQNTLTTAKLVLLIAIAIGCFWFGGDGIDSFRGLVPVTPLTHTVAGFGMAVTAALWAFSGWTGATFVGGELRDPSTTLPRALSYSVIGVTALALLVTSGFLWALPPVTAANSDRMIADTAAHVFGTAGGQLVTLAVIISCLAAVNGLLFAGARVTYAMARDGLFIPWAAKVNARRVPGNAVLCQGAWASVLMFTGRYDQLFTYVVVAVWLFYMLGGFAVVILRHQHPDDSRPHDVLGYPYVPVVFGIVAWALLLQTLWSHPRDSLIGIGLVLTGVPAYWYWSRRTNGEL